MKLIDNPKEVLRHYSTQALAFGVALNGVWAAYPDDLKMALGQGAVVWVARVSAVVLALGLLGKFIDQAKDVP